MSEIAQIPIEKGIPIPPGNRPGRPRGLVGSRYPISQMVIGDSFLLMDTDIHRAWVLVAYQAKRHRMKLALRNVVDGTRVWRVA